MGSSSSKDKDGKGRGSEAEAGAPSAEEEANSLRLEIQDLRKAIAVLGATVGDKRSDDSAPAASLAGMTTPQLTQERANLTEVYNVLVAQEAESSRDIMLRSKIGISSKGKPEPAKRTDKAAKAFTKAEIEAIEDIYVLLGQDSNSYMLQWNTKYVDQPCGPRDEKHRHSVREGTKRKVVQELGLAMFGAPAREATTLPPVSDATILFLDGGVDAKAMVPGALPGGPNLLGRYDLIVIRACADYDNAWTFKKGGRSDFFVGHAAAINIGESREAADFPEFCLRDDSNTVNNVIALGRTASAGVLCQLDVESYVEAMGRIIDNLAKACAHLRIEHLVFFPFGMGAFLRHLGKLDETFADDIQMQRLRRRLARRFVQSLGLASPKMQIHLCLRFEDEESGRNADAFLRALVDEEVAAVRSRVTIWPEADSLQVSTDLAAKSRYVMLANGANRRLLGNHWFAGRALKAIDENLHRRSWRMAALAYVLNGFDGQEPEGRSMDELQQTVRLLRGRVCNLSEVGGGPPSRFRSR